MGYCNCSMFCCALLYSSFAIILIGKRELVALLSLFSRSLVIVVWLFLVCLQFVIMVFPDHSRHFYVQYTCLISILSVLSKVLEKHVHDCSSVYLNENNLLHRTQSGFRSKHSCKTALVNMIDSWLNAMDNGELVGI